MVNSVKYSKIYRWIFILVVFFNLLLLIVLAVFYMDIKDNFANKLNQGVVSNIWRAIKLGANGLQDGNTNTHSDSFKLWQSIKMKPSKLPEKVNNTEWRHGPAIELYYETGLSFKQMSYEFPLRKKPNLSLSCVETLQLDRNVTKAALKITNYAEFLRNEDNELKSDLTNCSDFIQYMGYITDPLTAMEKEFPIAYSMLVYKNLVQVEMLLRAVYRPQNVHCIHVDLKSKPAFRSGVEKLVNCFENVFLTKRSVNVTWGMFSVLEPEIICLKELWKKSVVWKYWINLTEKEFPLRTNFELVKILTAFNGANNVHYHRSFDIPRRLHRSGYPPHNLKPIKGEVHVVLSRDFVDFALHNETARDLLNWSRDMLIPDESFFNILNYNPSLRAPGSYKGEDASTYLARFKNWFKQWYCYGKRVRYICVFAERDLPLLATREELFANKFHINYSPETLYCMEELLYNRTVDEYRGVLGFNVSYYQTRDFVKNKF